LDDDGALDDLHSGAGPSRRRAAAPMRAVTARVRAPLRRPAASLLRHRRAAHTGR
jgi:hypothetical protein